MSDSWRFAPISASMRKSDLEMIARQVPREYRPSGYGGGRITRAGLVAFIREAREAYYDAPPPKPKQSPKSLCQIPASEVNKMLRGFPPVAPV